MSAIIDQIRSFVEQIVQHTDVFIVDISLRGERQSKVVEVFVDTDKGISLDMCSSISRELSAKLDETDIIQGRYRLDVSSPGVDAPLKLLRQYKKNVGRICSVATIKDSASGPVEGMLESVTDGSIVVSKKGHKTEIAFSEIEKTIIIPQIK